MTHFSTTLLSNEDERAHCCSNVRRVLPGKFMLRKTEYATHDRADDTSAIFDFAVLQDVLNDVVA